MLTESMHTRVLSDLGSDQVYSSISINLGATFFHHGNKLAQILARADLALEGARQSGQNIMQIIVDDDHDSSSMGAFGWRAMIQKALAEGQWALFAQRVVSLADQSVLHHEILGRMIDAQGVLVPASYFLPMAIRHNFMPEVERALISLTLKQLTDPQRPLPKVALNIHAQCVKDKSFVKWLDETLKEQAPHSGRLVFEISEFSCARDIAATQRFVKMLRSRGAAFGIDHFGLSPQSLNTLRHIPPDYLKLDGGLVKDLLHNEDSRQLFASIMNLAQSLRVQVIATCVETEDQVAILRENQVAGGQGYLIGKPEAI
jgi:EAL domain-containing protein (putative c-di-GMP-specific phosphodiesterase class I)